MTGNVPVWKVSKHTVISNNNNNNNNNNSNNSNNNSNNNNNNKAYPSAGIVGSNPAGDMDVCV